MQLTSTGTRSRGRTGIGARLGAIALVFAMAFSTLAGLAPARVAAAPADLATATITPSDALFYAGTSLDLSTPQWKQAEVLLQRAANLTIEEALDKLFEESDDSPAASTPPTAALIGGEIALVALNLDILEGASNDLSGAIDSGELPSSSDLAIEPETSTEGLVLILKPSDMAAAMAFAKKELADTAASTGNSITTTTSNDVTIYAVEGSAGDSESGEAYAAAGDFLIVGSTVDDITPILDTWAGKTSPISELEAYSKASAALPQDRLAFGLSKGGSLTDAIASSSEDTDMSAVQQVLQRDPSHTGFALSAVDAGFKLDTVNIPDSGTAQEEPRGTAAGLTYASEFPADTVAFGNGYDLGRTSVLTGLGALLISSFASVLSLGQATPVVPPTLDEMYAQLEQMLGFNLKTDFIDQMHGQYGFGVWNVDAENPETSSAVIVSEVADPAALTTTVTGLSFLVQAAGQGKFNVTTATIGDANVSEIVIGADSGTPVKVSYGVVGDTFMLGLGDGVRTFVTPISDSLADNPDFKAALAELPAEHDSVFYVNLAKAIELGTQMEESDGGPLDELSANGVQNLTSIATVTYKDNGLAFSSTILTIGS